MDIGGFSVSLAVKDLQVSKAFYLKLGFDVIGGDENRDWLILQNGYARIGLFQGMFDRNILTFNPPDVRAVQEELKAAGVEFTAEADPTTEGPAHAMTQDPDGNPILLDQF